jgi:hypothetical protein
MVLVVAATFLVTCKRPKFIERYLISRQKFHKEQQNTQYIAAAAASSPAETTATPAHVCNNPLSPFS